MNIVNLNQIQFDEQYQLAIDPKRIAVIDDRFTRLNFIKFLWEKFKDFLGFESSINSRKLEEMKIKLISFGFEHDFLKSKLPPDFLRLENYDILEVVNHQCFDGGNKIEAYKAFCDAIIKCRFEEQYKIAMSEENIAMIDGEFRILNTIRYLWEKIKEWFFGESSIKPQDIENERVKLILLGFGADFIKSEIPDHVLKSASQANTIFAEINNYFRAPDDERKNSILVDLNNAIVKYDESNQIPLKIFPLSNKERFVQESFGEYIDPCSKKNTLIYDQFTQRFTITIPCLRLRYLTLSGGGAKGVYIPGVLKYLQEKNILREIDCISGASIGAISAALIAVGLSSEKIGKLCEFSRYMDKKPIQKEGNRITAMIRKNTRESVTKKLKALLGVHKLTQMTDNRIRAFLSHEKRLTETLVVEMRKLIEEKLRNTDPLTFSDLRTLHCFCPEIFKELTVTATCKSISESLFYFDAVHTPDLDIGLACRASSSIPIVFKDVQIEKKLLPGYTEYHQSDKKSYLTFVDGGYSDNIPVKSMEEKQTVSAMRGVNKQNLQTLAIVFDETTRITDPQSLFLETRLPKGRFLLNMSWKKKWLFGNKWLPKLLLGMKTSETYLESKLRGLESIRENYAQRAIVIRPTIDTTDFEQAEKKAETYYSQGYEFAKKYFELHSLEHKVENRIEEERVYHQVYNPDELYDLVQDEQEKEQLKEALEKIRMKVHP